MDTAINTPVVLEALDPAQVFTPGGVDPIIARIRAEATAEDIDISTPAGRKRCASVAYKVAQSKTFLDDMGKKLVEGWKEQAKLVDAERRKVRDELDALKDEVRRPLTDWENAEKVRVAGHEAALAAIAEPPSYGQHEAAAELSMRLEALRNYPARDWQEFAKRASNALSAEIARTEALLAAAEKREAEAAELARLRAEAAERERIAREEAIAAKARADAEAKAAAELQRQKQESEAREARAKAEQEARDRKAAEVLAQAERDRQAAIDAAAKAERDRVAAAEKAEQDRIAADAAAKRREQEAAERERAKIAAQQKAEADERARREADIENRKTVNRAAMSALMSATSVDEATARMVITAIAKGQVVGVSIAY